ncbi:MAG: MarR family winged helix-turn-helix transcriptional regulator [Nocardioides sp.]|uniref:MarR family winged helix-turn-helix transcriptional regulator n=1 Tax=Nocardioides sp. TaxID=35761 RepID=UPI0039E4B1F8
MVGEPRSVRGRGPSVARSFEQLEQQLGVLARQMKRVVADHADAVHPGLSTSAFLVLSRVADVGPVRAQAVCSEFVIDKGPVSRSVQQLVDLGLLERRTDPVDRRAALVSVTPKARLLLAEVEARREVLLADCLADWRPDEMGALAAGLERLNAALGSVARP